MLNAIVGFPTIPLLSILNYPITSKLVMFLRETIPQIGCSASQQPNSTRAIPRPYSPMRKAQCLLPVITGGSTHAIYLGGQLSPLI